MVTISRDCRVSGNLRRASNFSSVIAGTTLVNVRIKAGRPYLRLCKVLIICVKVRNALHFLVVRDQADPVNFVDLALFLLLREAVEDVDCEDLDEQVGERKLKQTDVVRFQPLLVLCYKICNRMVWADVVPKIVQQNCRLMVPKRPVEG